MRPKEPKRSNGEGSLYQRPDGRWRWQVTVGRNRNDKPARRSGTAATKRDARTAMTQALAQVQRGTMAVPSEITLGEWLDRWLSLRESQVAPSTLSQYKIRLRVHVPQSLRRMKLQEVRRVHLRDLDLQMVQRGLGAAMRGKVISHLRAALEEAVDLDVLHVNPAQGVHAKATSTERSVVKPKALAVQELDCFLKAAEGDRLYALLYTLFALGLRRGEALGLRWKDVDLNRRTVRVEQQVKLVENEVVIGSLKTPKSRRMLPMGEDLLEVISRHREAQERLRELCGPGWAETGLVFTTAVGTAIHPRNVNRTIHRLCKTAGVRRFGSHTGRYTNVTQRLRSGQPLEVVSALAGHANPSVTLDLYREVLDDEKRTLVLDLRSLRLSATDE